MVFTMKIAKEADMGHFWDVLMATVNKCFAMFLFVINEVIQTIFSLSQLARRGFSMMLISRSQEKLDDVAKSLGQYLAICVCVC